MTTVPEVRDEIERVFLGRRLPDEVLAAADSRERVRQGYLTAGEPSVRIRDRAGIWTLAVKSGTGRVRKEVEVPLSPEAGSVLMEMAGAHRVEKTRCRMGRWEVDLFEGKLTGLVLAECELEAADEPLPDPPEGVDLVREVTDEPDFRNQRLAFLDDEEARELVARAEQAG